MKSTTSASSFSTSKQKDAFMRTWYPNGVFVGARVAESMSLPQMLPRNIESLNTDSDISELAEFEHADLTPIAESAKAATSVSYADLSLGFQGSKSVSTRENVALVSNSLTHDQVNDWEVISGMQLSMGMESLTMSDGKLRNQNVGTLWKQLMKERKDRQECHFLLEQLQETYDALLQKYANAENTIDILRIRREFENVGARTLPLDYPQMARFRNGDNEESWLTLHRMCELRRSTKVHEYHSREFRSSNGSNTNPTQKPSILSIRLRANCLKDQINFTKMAMQEENGRFSQNSEIVREFEDNLEVLKQDYKALKSSEKDHGLETDILQLQAALQELESSLGIEPRRSEPRKESHPASSSRKFRKPDNTQSTFQQSARQVMWPPPISLNNREIGDGAHHQSPTRRQSIAMREIIGVPPNPLGAPKYLTSVSYFGKLNTSMCIDKKVPKSNQNEQNPNFSLGRSSLLDEQNPDLAIANLQRGSDNNLITNPGHGKQHVPGNPRAKRPDGPKATKNSNKSSSQTLAHKPQETAIRFEGRRGNLVGSADIHKEEYKINLKSKEDKIAKLKILLKLHAADKKAYDLYKKSGEILSRISSSDSKHFPNVYY